MQEKEKKNIDDVVALIDSFMTKGGGHIKISSDDSTEVKKTICPTCCGETTDNACNTPVKKDPK